MDISNVLFVEWADRLTGSAVGRLPEDMGKADAALDIIPFDTFCAMDHLPQKGSSLWEIGPDGHMDAHFLHFLQNRSIPASMGLVSASGRSVSNMRFVRNMEPKKGDSICPMRLYSPSPLYALTSFHVQSRSKLIFLKKRILITSKLDDDYLDI